MVPGAQRSCSALAAARPRRGLHAYGKGLHAMPTIEVASPKELVQS